MSTNDIIINRDTANDMLYVMRSGVDKEKTTNLGITADIIIRLDENKQVVGLTIEDFSKVWPHLNESKDYVLMEYFDMMIEALNGACQLAS